MYTLRVWSSAGSCKIVLDYQSYIVREQGKGGAFRIETCGLLFKENLHF